MREKIFSLMLAITLLFSFNAPSVYAWDIVNDPIMTAKQILQYGVEVATKYGVYLTAANTYLSFINETYLKPLYEYLTIAAILTSTQNINNLIMGSLGNGGVFLTNPENYIKGKALNSVKVNLGTVAAQKGIYSNSILNSVIGVTRSGNSIVSGYSDISKALSSLSQSSIPTMVQNNLCTDGALTQAAQTDVRKADGSINPADVSARKKVIFDALCKGDPTIDIDLSKKLISVNMQRPSIGGLDTFYQTTVNGDNEYSKAMRAQDMIMKDAQNKLNLAVQETTSGGGLKSLTDCGERAKADLNGSTTVPTDSLPCASEIVKQTSGALKTLFDEANASPLKSLQANLNGATSFLGTIFNTIQLVNGITSATNQIGANFGGGGGGSGGGSYSGSITYDGGGGYNSSSGGYNSGGTSNSSGGNYSSGGMTTDQSSTLGQINSVTSMMQNTMAQRDKTINDGMKKTDTDYLKDINAYESALQTATSCYTSLVTDFGKPKDGTQFLVGGVDSGGPYVDDPPDPNFVNFYNSEEPPNNQLKLKISAELQKVSDASQQTSATSNSIPDVAGDASSIQASIDYLSNKKNGDSLDAMSIGDRTSEAMQYHDKVYGNPASPGSMDTVNSYMKKCDQIRQDITTARANKSSG